MAVLLFHRNQLFLGLHPYLLLYLSLSIIDVCCGFSVARSADFVAVSDAVKVSQDGAVTEPHPYPTLGSDSSKADHESVRFDRNSKGLYDDSADEWHLRNVLDDRIRQIQCTLLKERWTIADVDQVAFALSSSAILESVPTHSRVLVAGFIQLLISVSVPEENAIPMQDDMDSSPYLSKEFILAAIWHCFELIQGRRLGFNNMDAIRRSLYIPGKKQCSKGRHESSMSCALEVYSNDSVIPIFNSEGSSFEPSILPIPTKSLVSTTIPAVTIDPSATSTMEESFTIWRITRGAAQMHRVEALARAVGATPRLSSEDGKRLRGLLLTAPGYDWRALLIRCVSCLHYLENSPRTEESIRAAREGIRVYGSLAEQLGLVKLKARLEDAAFRILYQRQYATVKSMMYQGPEKGSSVQAAATFLEAHIKASLFTDDLLRSQQAAVYVTSRVKEPFSLWKKLIKKHFASHRGSDENSRALALKSTPNAATSIVPDFVALRVVLHVSKLSPCESLEASKAREQLLCYYIQEKLQSLWPLHHDRSRMKDYIQFPKANGYQSLHFTSKVSFGGFDLPFEIQVRTTEMHKHAEYGPASHWGYKLGDSTTARLLPDDTTSTLSLTRNTRSMWGRDTPHKNPYLEALSLSQRETSGQTIYVFTSVANVASSGSLLALSRNTSLGDLAPRAGGDILLNGKPAQGEELLQSGDVVVFCD